MAQAQQLLLMILNYYSEWQILSTKTDLLLLLLFTCLAASEFAAVARQRV